MIFLSHNYKDKPLIDQLAIRLTMIFGQDNIFYDSWSIQPGDGIIDKMNNGLESCKYFFLFVSQNSLNSKMVKLEWQNALMKAVHGDLKIIPVRIDASLLPAILTQTLYLDLYTNGLEVTLKQMVDVIQGNNTFHPVNHNFSNLEAKISSVDSGYNIDIIARYFMEPRSHYIILMQNNREDVNVGLRRSGMMQSGYTPNLTLNNGFHGNGWSVGVSEATIPNFPLELSIKKNLDKPITISAILHEYSKDMWNSMPLKY